MTMCLHPSALRSTQKSATRLQPEEDKIHQTEIALILQYLGLVYTLIHPALSHIFVQVHEEGAQVQPTCEAAAR